MSRIDLEVYIGKTFVSNSGEMFKVTGVAGKTNTGIKKYSVEFEDGTIGVEIGQTIRNGGVKKKTGADEIIDMQDDEITRLKRVNQNMADKLRIFRKDERAQLREDNILEQFIQSVSESLADYKFNGKAATLNNQGDTEAIMHISDNHIGKKVELYNNKFDLDTAFTRMITYANICIDEMKRRSIKKVTLCFTGDNANNLDHRRDQKLTNQFTRGEAFVHAVMTYNRLITKLLEEGFVVDVAGVPGNESRILADEPFTNVSSLCKDNFDYMMHQMLKNMFSGSVTFLNDCSEIEDMIIVNGKKIIMAHGDKFNHSKLDLEIKNLKMKWFYKTNTMADYAIFGHIHSPLVTSEYARSGSIVGNDDYASIGLNIPNSAVSQNLLIVEKERITPLIINI